MPVSARTLAYHMAAGVFLRSDSLRYAQQEAPRCVIGRNCFETATLTRQLLVCPAAAAAAARVMEASTTKSRRGIILRKLTATAVLLIVDQGDSVAALGNGAPTPTVYIAFD